mgnify:FL=1
MNWSGNPSKNKYKNKKITVYNIRFDSIAESNRYLILRSDQSKGLIINLDLQPKYELQKKGVNKWGQKYREITYTPDFQYIKNEVLTVEDCKGAKSEGYSLRRRLFMKKHPDIKFLET